MMVDFQLLRIHKAIQEKLTNSYIKMDENGMEWTIGGHQAVDKMQQNLIGLSNKSSVS